MILDICGGEVSEMVLAGNEDNVTQRVAYIRPSRIKEFIGIEVSEDKVLEILNNLGFQTSVEGDKIKAISPTWRGDIEGEHDLIEEVVRMIGLDNIPANSLPTIGFPKQVLNALQTNVVTIKHELASRGMFETVTWSFTDSNIAQYFSPEDRRHQGLLLEKNVKENTSLPSLYENSKAGFINFKWETESAIEYIKKMRTKTPTERALVKNLSGGNQHARHILARCSMFLNGKH